MALNNAPDNHWYGAFRLDGTLDVSGAFSCDSLTSSSTIADLLRLTVLGSDPVAPVDGDIWRTAAGLRGKIGGDIGTFTFVVDP